MSLTLLCILQCSAETICAIFEWTTSGTGRNLACRSTELRLCWFNLTELSFLSVGCTAACSVDQPCKIWGSLGHWSNLTLVKLIPVLQRYHLPARYLIHWAKSRYALFPGDKINQCYVHSAFITFIFPPLFLSGSGGCAYILSKSDLIGPTPVLNLTEPDSMNWDRVIIRGCLWNKSLSLDFM